MITLFLQMLFLSINAQTTQMTKPCDYKNGSFKRICYANQTIFPNSPYSVNSEFIKYRLCNKRDGAYVSDYVIFAKKDFPDTIRYVINNVPNDGLYINVPNGARLTTSSDTLRLHFKNSVTFFVKSKEYIFKIYTTIDGRQHYWNSELGIIKVTGDPLDCYQSHNLSVADKQRNKAISSILKQIQ